MFKYTNILFYCLLLFTRLNTSTGSYAIQYPYHHDHHGPFQQSHSDGHQTSSTNEAGDRNSLYKNHEQDKGNNIHTNEDVRNFVNKENLSKGHNLQSDKGGVTLEDKRHAAGENFETDKTHNRKEIKTGFHTTYSKDERGTNSSFYEDSDDHGGKLIYDKRHDAHGNIFDGKFHEGARDGHVQHKVDDRFGGYKAGTARDRQHFVAHDKGMEYRREI